MNTDLIGLAVIIGFFVLLTLVFIRMRRRRGGSSAAMFMITQGATDAFLDHDKKQAIEIIVERNAGKKMEEQSAEGGKNPKEKEEDKQSGSENSTEKEPFSKGRKHE